MEKEKELLAYFGDCAGFSGEIADSARNLKEQLMNYKFDRTRRVLFPEKLKEYEKFCDLLEFMTTLKCEMICRKRQDDETTCKIRKCSRNKDYFACYECKIFEKCEKLKTRLELHGDAYIKNLQAIREMGLEKWVKKGKRYWFGSDLND